MLRHDALFNAAFGIAGVLGSFITIGAYENDIKIVGAAITGAGVVGSVALGTTNFANFFKNDRPFFKAAYALTFFSFALCTTACTMALFNKEDSRLDPLFTGESQLDQKLTGLVYAATALTLAAVATSLGANKSNSSDEQQRLLTPDQSA